MSQNKKVWTVLSMLEWATNYFEERKVPHSRLSIEWLLAEVLNVKRLDLYMKYDRPLSPGELGRLRPMVKRRSQHEPLQYITGTTEFLNCRIHVGPQVLIPRPETEQLVDLILKEHPDPATKHVLDLGTGSGCIPIALKSAREQWTGTGVDISSEALDLAQKNMRENQVEVQLLQASFDQLGKEVLHEDRFDIITANPPYILPSEEESLEREVKEFEPRQALFHDQPVELYRTIGDYAATHLRDSGALYLECNDKLIDEIRDVLETLFRQVEILQDYDRKDRFVRALNPG